MGLRSKHSRKIITHILKETNHTWISLFFILLLLFCVSAFYLNLIALMVNYVCNNFKESNHDEKQNIIKLCNASICFNGSGLRQRRKEKQRKPLQHQQRKSLKKLRLHQLQQLKRQLLKLQLLGLLLGQKKYPLQILNVSEMKNMVISISLKIGSYALLEVAKRSNIYHQINTMR